MGNSAILLAETIKSILAIRKVSQREFAQLLGVQPSNVSRQLSEDPPDPTLSTLVRYADALEVQPWELLKPPGATPTVRTLSFEDAIEELKAAHLRDIQQASRIGAHAAIDTLSQGNPMLDKVNAAAAAGRGTRTLNVPAKVAEALQQGVVDWDDIWQVVEAKRENPDGTDPAPKKPAKDRS